VTEECQSGGMTAPSPELLARVRAWLASDPDPETRNELKSLIACNDGEQMAARFDRSLSFGTAGLRGTIGAGPNRMNQVVVAYASAGLAAYLAGICDVAPRVVVGCDARTNSGIFATVTAEVLAGAGCEVILLPPELPTPVLAFAVRHLEADAGVMITASHNPAGDNGYKVYLGGDSRGAQIITPTDKEIESLIAQASATPFAQIPRSPVTTVAHDIVAAYAVATASAVGPRWATGAPSPTTSEDTLRVVYTPMHGVGLSTLHAVLSAAGYAMPDVVAEQALPDAAFPSVAFPNPEEEGALDLAMSLARAEQADLIIANDPDADRLAIAVPDTAAATRYRMLTGDELGVLLAWWAAERARATGRTGALATTVVSAPALEAIAADYKLDCHRTLSGFKWIGRVPGLIYGYEEALGYLVNPETLADKDGISAALAVLEIAHAQHAQGSSIDDKVRELAATFGGVYGTSFSVRDGSLEQLTERMAALRASTPNELAGRKLVTVDDYLPGFNGLPPTNLLAWHLDDGSRVMLRPSGTEPKLKFYVHASTRADSEQIATAVKLLVE
jgi:phosphomannomutase